MFSLNKVELTGNLTADPVIRNTGEGTSVTNFTIAHNRTFKTKNGESNSEASFIDVELWGKQAEIFCQHMKKGRAVFVEGRLRQDRWQTKEGENRSKIVLSASNFQFIDSPKNKNSSDEEPTLENVNDEVPF